MFSMETSQAWLKTHKIVSTSTKQLKPQTVKLEINQVVQNGFDNNL